jgi:hypothetical protein
MTQACRICGQPVIAGNTFCGSCGARVSDDAPQTVQTVTQTAAPETPAAPAVMSNTAPITTPTSFNGPVTAPTVPIAAPAAAAETGFGPRQRNVFIASALAFVLVAGLVGFLRARPPVDQGQLVADGPITASGGTIPFENGGKVEAPAGAVNGTKHITIHKTYIQREVQIGGTTYPPGTFPLYIFGPNIAFLRPVTIILPLPPGAVAGRIYVLLNGRLIFLAQRPNQGGFVIFTVTGFNRGALIGVRAA